MLWRLFTLVSALSLLLSVAFTALWVRSRDVHEQVFGARRGGRLWWVESNRGRVEVVVVGEWPVAESVAHVREPRSSPGGRDYVADGSASIREWLAVRVVRGRAEVGVLTNGPPFIGDSEIAEVRDRIRSFGQRNGYVPLTADRDGRWCVGSDAGGGFAVVAPPRPLWAVQFPHALAAAVFAVPPVGWLVSVARRALVRRRRLRRGLCGGCGYDLTGNASGVCPECGGGLSVVAAPTRVAEVPSSE